MKYSVVAVLGLLSLIVKTGKSWRLIRFGGAGIFFWWQAGAATYLQQHYDLSQTNFIGASAGAITASLLLVDANFYTAAKYAITQVEDLGLDKSKSGLRGVWGGLVREFLEDMLPQQIDKKELARIHVVVTPRQILEGRKLLSNFQDKEDLIAAIMASVHIPLFMDGKMWSEYKGKKYIDGSFWSFVKRRQPLLPPELRYDPIPRELGKLDWRRDVLDVRYMEDEKFRKDVDINSYVRLITPEALYKMMDYGYDYMDRSVKQGKFSANMSGPYLI